MADNTHFVVFILSSALDPATQYTHSHFTLIQLIQNFLTMPYKPLNKSTPLKSNEPIVESRYHLRTLKHFPQLYKENRLQPLPFEYDDDDDCFADLKPVSSDNNADLDKSTRFAQKLRYYERVSDCSPYQRPIKMIKSSRKFRRKHYDLENDVQGHLSDANAFAHHSDGGFMAHSPSMSKRITHLFDGLEREIRKVKCECRGTFWGLLSQFNIMT